MRGVSPLPTNQQVIALFRDFTVGVVFLSLHVTYFESSDFHWKHRRTIRWLQPYLSKFNLVRIVLKIVSSLYWWSQFSITNQTPGISTVVSFAERVDSGYALTSCALLASYSMNRKWIRWDQSFRCRMCRSQQGMTEPSLVSERNELRIE